MLDFGINW